MVPWREPEKGMVGLRVSANRVRDTQALVLSREMKAHGAGRAGGVATKNRLTTVTQPFHSGLNMAVPPKPRLKFKVKYEI